MHREHIRRHTWTTRWNGFRMPTASTNCASAATYAREEKSNSCGDGMDVPPWPIQSGAMHSYPALLSTPTSVLRQMPVLSVAIARAAAFKSYAGNRVLHTAGAYL